MIKVCVCVCASGSHLAASPHFCICAKVLVSDRQPHPGGSDPEEGPGACVDKLLGKDGAAFLQLPLVSEEFVHGAGQLLPGGCK